MPTIITKGNISASAYGLSLGATVKPVYSDNVFSTYLYTGNGTSQTITNGIDLVDNQGMVWIKDRTAANNNALFDTIDGAYEYYSSNSNSGYVADVGSLSNFRSNGFSIGSSTLVNQNNHNYASWTFVKQPKFFDVIQYNGNGSVQNIAHSLGSVPGCIMIKSIAAADWAVYHSGMNGGVNPEQYYAVLNTTAAQTASSAWWNNTAPTSTQFTLGNSSTVNTNGEQYIAFVFASNAGGFGATGTDNIISCGSFTADGSGNVSVNLGYEPQWVLTKCTSAADPWVISDVMRGFSNTQENILQPNTSNAETDLTNNPSYFLPTATGFQTGIDGLFGASQSYIYIAIRRPMAVPTTGTSVFSPSVTSFVPNIIGPITTNFPVDWNIGKSNLGYPSNVVDRLRGDSATSFAGLCTSDTTAENDQSGYGIALDNNTGFTDHNVNGEISGNGTYWNFARASGFFDVVCYTGTGSATTFNHNLGVVPELMIVKSRSSGGGAYFWYVYVASLGATQQLQLDLNNPAGAAGNFWNSTDPTSSVFSIGNTIAGNNPGTTFVTYLFATCSGVSKVGSFTGTGGTQSIACGFGSGGARFILIKQTDSAGDWYCFDSANGLTSTSSPYLLWDSSSGQVTGNNGCYASAGGFTLTSNASATVNINGASYIFLSVA
jgi:hypothetical protein